MKLRTKKALFLAVGVVGLKAWQPTFAATFTWDGAPDAGGTSADNLVTTGTNWVGDVAPSLATSTGATWLFTGTAAQLNPGTPYAGSGGGAVSAIIFAPGAAGYTLQQQSGTGAINDLSFVSIFNNSSNDQNIDAALNTAGGVLSSAGGNLNIGPTPVTTTYTYSNTIPYLYANTAMSIDLTHNINVNYPQLQSGARNVYGPGDTSTTPAQMAGVNGVLSLNVDSGTTSTANQSFTGTVNIWSGAVLVTSNDALGRAAANSRAYVHGTFPTATAVNQANINTGGFEHGFGALEFANNVTVQQRIRVDSRLGDVADYDDIVNVSGNNQLGTTAAPTTTGWTQIGGGGHFNIDSLSGTLTFLNIPSVSDPGHSGGAAVNNIFTFRGAGNVTVGSPGKIIAANAGDGLTTVRKQGGGILTLSGQSSTWDGGTMVDGGTLAISSTGSYTSGAGRIHIGSGAALDVSAMASGLSLSSNQSLSGTGTVYGQLISNGSTISPGGTDSLNSNDVLTVANGVGALGINGGLTSNDASTWQYDLSNNTSSGNDVINVTGSLNLSGTTTINVNPINGQLAAGTYTLVNYTGSLSGGTTNFALNIGGRGVVAALDTSTANELNLHVTSSAPSANLTWAGGLNSNAFDVVTTVNWTGAYDGDNRFYNGDSVSFGDTGSNSPNVNVVGTPTPGAVSFSNSSGHDYTLSGSGTINDTGNLTISGSGNVTLSNAAVNVGGAINMNGTGSLILTGSTAVTAVGGMALNSGTVSINAGASNVTIPVNITAGTGVLEKDGTGIATLSGNNSTFDGPVIVAAGTLRTTGAGALGSSVGSTTVNTGATLDLYGSNLGTEVVAVSGTGAAGQRGALVDTAGQGNRVISHINGIVLNGDTTICAQNSVTTQTNGSFMFVDGNNAFVMGNGHNLTLNVDADCEMDWFVGTTNIGNINVIGAGGNNGAGGVFYIGGDTDLGSNGTLTLSNGAKLGLYGSSVVNTKPIVIDTSGTGIAGIEYDIIDTNVGSINATTLGSPITANGNLDVWTYKPQSTRPLTLSGPISGNGAIAFHGNGPGAGVYFVTSDTSTCSGPITIGGGGGLNNVSATTDLITLSVGNGGTTGSLGTSSIDDEGTLQFDKNGTYTVPNSISGNGTVTFVASGGNVLMTGPNEYLGQTVVQGGTVELSTASQDSVLSGFANGTDIQKGRMIFDYSGTSNIATVNQMVKNGYASSDANHTHFAFISGQIFSTTSTSLIGLGVKDIGTGTEVAVAYYGDANLDGTVNALDFNALATNYGSTSAYWNQGDFDYDGTVGSSDFDVLAANYGLTLPAGGAIADAQGMSALGEVVPEPGAVLMLGIAGMVAARRRGRR